MAISLPELLTLSDVKRLQAAFQASYDAAQAMDSPLNRDETAKQVYEGTVAEPLRLFERDMKAITEGEKVAETLESPKSMVEALSADMDADDLRNYIAYRTLPRLWKRVALELGEFAEQTNADLVHNEAFADVLEENVRFIKRHLLFKIEQESPDRDKTDEARAQYAANQSKFDAHFNYVAREFALEVGAFLQRSEPDIGNAVS